MDERRDGLDRPSDEDRAVDKPRKRKPQPGADRDSPTSKPEQFEEFTGTERPRSTARKRKRGTTDPADPPRR